MGEEEGVNFRSQELCRSRCGRPRLQSIINLMVSVDIIKAP